MVFSVVISEKKEFKILLNTSAIVTRILKYFWKKIKAKTRELEKECQ